MFLQDQEARKLAVENNSRNIIVEAGAGKGKTTLLVQKMLFLVFVKKVKLSRIVALTFTTKAAASLKQKMEENLHTAYEILLHNSFILTSDENTYAEHLKDFKHGLYKMVQLNDDRIVATSSDNYLVFWNNTDSIL